MLLLLNTGGGRIFSNVAAKPAQDFVLPSSSCFRFLGWGWCADGIGATWGNSYCIPLCITRTILLLYDTTIFMLRKARIFTGRWFCLVSTRARSRRHCTRNVRYDVLESPLHAPPFSALLKKRITASTLSKSAGVCIVTASS